MTIFRTQSSNQKTKAVRRSREGGVALLFVILLTSVLLLVALGISNISYKELVFSLEARDSDKAFFASDTGIECALYLDRLGVFASGIGTTGSCGGTTYSVGSGITGPLGMLASYQFIVQAGGKCAQIEVDKNYTDAALVSYTQFISSGYNVAHSGSSTTTCLSGTPGPRVVTRVLRATYPN